MDITTYPSIKPATPFSPSSPPVTNRKQSDGFDDVDAALEAWARWGRSVLSGIGWPQWTLLARVIEQGFTGAAQRGARTFEVDEAMEWVERAVLRLAENERRVICKHYLYWQPPEVSAQFCGMSYGHFRVVLNRARRRIRDYLADRGIDRLR